MATTTPNYALIKPNIGEEGWGPMINDNQDILDENLDRIDTQLIPEHNTDGTHGDINADSLKVGGQSVGAMDSGIATSVAALAINDTGKVWSTNIFQSGHSVVYLSGGLTAVTDVVSNTATQLVLAAGSAAPDSGTTYAIYATGAPDINNAIANSLAGEATIKQNLLSANFAEVWSNSTGLYNTDDAIPVAADATDLVEDNSAGSGTVWTGATGATPPNGWSVGTAGLYTIDGASGSGSEPGLDIAHNGVNNNPFTHMVMTTEIGKLYQVSANVKNIDATSIGLWIGTSASGSQYGKVETTAAAWLGDTTLEFVATTTTTYLSIVLITSTGAQHGKIDSIFLHEVTPGIVSGTDGPDGMDKNTAIALYRSHSDGSTEAVTKLGEFYALKSVTSSTSQWVRRFADVGGLLNVETNIRKYTGKQVVYGEWVMSSDANTARIALFDGSLLTHSDYHTGGGAWEWLGAGSRRQREPFGRGAWEPWLWRAA